MRATLPLTAVPLVWRGAVAAWFLAGHAGGFVGLAGLGTVVVVKGLGALGLGAL